MTDDPKTTICDWQPRSTAPDTDDEIVGYSPEAGDVERDEDATHCHITTGRFLRTGGWEACTYTLAASAGTAEMTDDLKTGCGEDGCGVWRACCQPDCPIEMIDVRDGVWRWRPRDAGHASAIPGYGELVRAEPAYGAVPPPPSPSLLRWRGAFTKPAEQIHLIEIAFDDIDERDRMFSLIEALLYRELPGFSGLLAARSE